MAKSKKSKKKTEETSLLQDKKHQGYNASGTAIQEINAALVRWLGDEEGARKGKDTKSKLKYGFGIALGVVGLGVTPIAAAGWAMALDGARNAKSVARLKHTVRTAGNVIDDQESGSSKAQEVAYAVVANVLQDRFGDDVFTRPEGLPEIRASKIVKALNLLTATFQNPIFQDVSDKDKTALGERCLNAHITPHNTKYNALKGFFTRDTKKQYNIKGRELQLQLEQEITLRGGEVEDVLSSRVATHAQKAASLLPDGQYDKKTAKWLAKNQPNLEAFNQALVQGLQHEYTESNAKLLKGRKKLGAGGATMTAGMAAAIPTLFVSLVPAAIGAVIALDGERNIDHAHITKDQITTLYPAILTDGYALQHGRLSVSTLIAYDAMATVLRKQFGDTSTWDDIFNIVRPSKVADAIKMIAKHLEKEKLTLKDQEALATEWLEAALKEHNSKYNAVKNVLPGEKKEQYTVGMKKLTKAVKSHQEKPSVLDTDEDILAREPANSAWVTLAESDDNPLPTRSHKASAVAAPTVGTSSEEDTTTWVARSSSSSSSDISIS